MADAQPDERETKFWDSAELLTYALWWDFMLNTDHDAWDGMNAVTGTIAEWAYDFAQHIIQSTGDAPFTIGDIPNMASWAPVDDATIQRAKDFHALLKARHPWWDEKKDA